MADKVKTRPHELVPKAVWVNLRLEGLTPLLMHNVRLADKLDEYSLAITEITNRMKANTISDEEGEAEKSRLQFLGALYWDEDHGLHLPGHNIFRSFYEGASALGRKGTTLDAAVVEFDDYPAVQPYTARYDDPEVLFKEGHFHRTNVKIPSSRSTVLSTRPMFSPWTVEIEFAVKVDVMPIEDFVAAAVLAGSMKGVGDGRLKGYRKGRYAVSVI